jgi:pyruvoyl-dependent arginine decarboxylase (PvlArgDC)
MEAVAEEAVAVAESAPTSAARICLAAGAGRGTHTARGARCGADEGGGVANYNLLWLSSVIPPVSEIARGGDWCGAQ